MKIRIRVIPFILMLSVLVTLSPTVIMSADIANEDVTSINENTDLALPENFSDLDLVELQGGTVPDQEDDVLIVAEDISKRNKFEKHYYCSDGTYIVVTYPEAVHYLDESGKWIDINNSFILDDVTGLYKAENDDFTASFSHNVIKSDRGESGYSVNAFDKPVAQNNLVSLKKGEHSLSWTLNAVKKTTSIDFTNNDTGLQMAGNAELSFAEKQTLSVNAKEVKFRNVRTDNCAYTGLSFIGSKIGDINSFALDNIYNVVEYTSLFGEDEDVFVKYSVTGHCVEIKNYTITTASGRNNLVNNVVVQYNQRKSLMPSDTTFEVVIDVRGQDWTYDMLNELISRITEATNVDLSVSFITQ